ncbi:cytochrome b [Legionella jordanis]|uniref:Cytochrome b561 transmembrane protein n=1 Tax=Legionella jordanis TaxID=456 RepID=A0A0W0VDY4_9GAMM|nr:cytochrome b [Legionella jordanis]KTD18322.1 cytochrome b561 transmembrane protein [Legionella jordanis]RMX05238.1 cytochrome b [Legionella jordanis]VEH13332.1 cytochrome b561 transmembrane protein [Legionella jordanis]HAT8713678.1 cytochrome b [Legionella jordanis]
MKLRNSNERYGLVSISLHWLIAGLIIALLIMGFYMTNLPISLQKLKWYGWHKEYGFLVLGLAIIRIFWRLMNVPPGLLLPTWERIAAKTVHWVFYVFMLALPLSGWAITSAAGLPASFFGLFTLPNLLAPDENARALFEEIHEYLAYGLIAFIVLHTAAALKHHFIDKDDILRRML